MPGPSDQRSHQDRPQQQGLPDGPRPPAEQLEQPAPGSPLRAAKGPRGPAAREPPQRAPPPRGAQHVHPHRDRRGGQPSAGGVAVAPDLAADRGAAAGADPRGLHATELHDREPVGTAGVQALSRPGDPPARALQRVPPEPQGAAGGAGEEVPHGGHPEVRLRHQLAQGQGPEPEGRQRGHHFGTGIPAPQLPPRRRLRARAGSASAAQARPAPQLPRHGPPRPGSPVPRSDHGASCRVVHDAEPDHRGAPRPRGRRRPRAARLAARVLRVPRGGELGQQGDQGGRGSSSGGLSGASSQRKPKDAALTKDADVARRQVVVLRSLIHETVLTEDDYIRSLVKMSDFFRRVDYEVDPAVVQFVGGHPSLTAIASAGRALIPLNFSLLKKFRDRKVLAQTGAHEPPPASPEEAIQGIYDTLDCAERFLRGEPRPGVQEAAARSPGSARYVYETEPHVGGWGIHSLAHDSTHPAVATLPAASQGNAQGHPQAPERAASQRGGEYEVISDTTGGEKRGAAH
eukprot:scaffold1659_cov255-Pinguiococcus_pyrenoidosus.AAC.25